ncbi:hypothetical protein GSI_08818 [Ganoderma sinense ZZ0214-1]|uniref:Uncharacterized protein n=1 Tax=Ganoderma sinense ZZ0214-1 TaxID=1077348 RepID=A0A2G8S4W9_9APHY|nr:hypothetical protein GSI_08818 [Ganoderma sinense ZZ0214-1]
MANATKVNCTSRKLTEFDISRSRGSSLHVSGVMLVPSNSASGRQTLPATHVILAADLPTTRPTRYTAVALGDDSPVPDAVDEVEVDARACESIREHVASISVELREGRVEAAGGGPVVGAADWVAKGPVIATGHTRWGICNAPGTAKAVPGLVMDGKIECAILDKLRRFRFL